MLIKRLIFDEIQKVLDTNKIIILRWPRQVGKTTIMKDLQTTFKSQKTVFLDMDDLDIKEKIKTAWNLINYIKFEYSYQENEDIVIFLDEFQNIENAGVFLKNIYDKYSNIKLICSWSSSLEITKNIEHLTGRKIVFDITPFTFKEYLKARKFKNYNIKFNINNFNEINDFYNIYQNELENFLKEYLTIWWYPEIVLTTWNIRKNIAKDIIETYIQKDITSFLHIENIQAFNNLLKIISSQIWSLLNKSELNATLWISINTLKKYLNILEWTFIINILNPFYKNVRKELSKMPKIYFNDMWIRNYLLYWNLEELPTANIWELVENFVYNELKLKDNNWINFYRTISKAEIDFIFQKSFDKIIPMEVKYRNKVNVPEIMQNFSKNYSSKIDKKIIITKNKLEIKEDVYLIPACLVSFINL